MTHKLIMCTPTDMNGCDIIGLVGIVMTPVRAIGRIELFGIIMMLIGANGRYLNFDRQPDCNSNHWHFVPEVRAHGLCWQERARHIHSPARCTMPREVYSRP